MEVQIQKALLLRSTLYKDVAKPLLAELVDIAKEQGLDAKGVAKEFDKFMTVSRQDSTSVTVADVTLFAEATKKAKAPALAPVPQFDNLFKRTNWEEALNDEEDPQPANQRITPYLNKSAVRPASARRHQVVTPASASKVFRERTNSGVVQVSLNPNNIEVAETAMDIDRPACEVEILGWPMQTDERYMVDGVQEKVSHIEHRILQLENEVKRLLGDDSIHPVASVAQNVTFFVGRICCDTEEGRLNAQSALLEGSMETSHGSRVRLDLTNCAEYRLFPGEVIAVKGCNPSGHCIVANEIITGLPQAKKETTRDESESDGRMQSYVIAAGPFTTTDDLAYEPLTALIKYCESHKPDGVILVGPFVDADHPMLRDGLLDETFEEVFESRIRAPLQKFVNESGSSTRIMLMPSPQDVHHDPIFPQPPFNAETSTVSLPNPSTFSCNNIVMGCSSVDWLMACGKEEVAKVAGQVDRLAALASHVIYQRTFYPLFPAALGTPLDSSKHASLELPSTPDLLVLPSDLAAFAKVLPIAKPSLTDGDAAGAGAATPVICINPGKLTKGSSGGSFAHVYVAAKDASLPSASVDQRCKVEIKKI